MTKQEYLFIRILSLDLLIDAKISTLPVDIRKIANVYGMESQVVNTKSLYENTLLISKLILSKYGFDDAFPNRKCLSVYTLAPIVILKRLPINSSDDVSKYTYLPRPEAVMQFGRLQEQSSHSKPEVSRVEKRVLGQFTPWINTVLM